MTDDSALTIDVGNTVAIVTNMARCVLNTSGMRGCLQMKDAKAGICVKLFISRIYQPCFWYKPDDLGSIRVSSSKEWAAVKYGSLEIALGLRTRRLPNEPITRGCLRSWLLDRATVPLGHLLEGIILNMPYQELHNMWSREGAYKDWVEYYDTRPRRTKIVESKELVSGFIGVRRTRIMGGK